MVSLKLEVAQRLCVSKIGLGLDNDKVYDSGLQNKMQDAVHLQLGFCIYWLCVLMVHARHVSVVWLGSFMSCMQWYTCDMNKNGQVVITILIITTPRHRVTIVKLGS